MHSKAVVFKQRSRRRSADADDAREGRKTKEDEEGLCQADAEKKAKTRKEKKRKDKKEKENERKKWEGGLNHRFRLL
jgi:hypothetical protein